MIDDRKRRRANLYDTLFIHIPKNAGVSINTHLQMDDKNHQIAWRVRKWLGEEDWNKVFSFSVVRNPFDRAVSMWSHFGRAQPFDKWLWDNAETEGILDLRQWPWICDPATKEPIVKMILRFEQLDDFFVDIPHLNVGKHPLYSEIFGAEDVEIIQERCSHDFELFGYDNDIWI